MMMMMMGNKEVRRTALWKCYVCWSEVGDDSALEGLIEL